MKQTLYMNHTTGELYATKEDAIEDYRNGFRIDLYLWHMDSGEMVLRAYWEP